MMAAIAAARRRLRASSRSGMRTGWIDGARTDGAIPGKTVAVAVAPESAFEVAIPDVVPNGGRDEDADSCPPAGGWAGRGPIIDGRAVV